MRELTSANCGKAGEYFFAKLFFWVISVCTEASAEASTVTRKKNVKKTQRSNQYKLNNRKLRKNGLPGREIASSKLAQVSTATNSPPKLFRCILAVNWRFEFGVTGYKFWNWYNLWNAISLLTAGNVQKTIQSTASLRTNGHEFLISWTLQLWDLRKNAEFLVLFLFLCGI